MFTFAATPVMFVGLLLLFTFCTVWSAVELTRGRTLVHRVSTGLHLVMSVVMLLMVASVTWLPLRATVGLPALVGFFALATLWFVVLAASGPRWGIEGQRAHFVGHAAMFAAMTWHLAAMLVRMRSMMAAGVQPGAHHGDPSAMAAFTASGTPAWWAAVIGLPFMAYLLVSGAMAAWQAVAPAAYGAAAGHGSHAVPAASGAAAGHAGAPGAAVPPAPGVPAPELVAVGCSEAHVRGGATHRLSTASGAAMNLGMFWMSVGLVAPVVPWLGVLQF